MATEQVAENFQYRAYCREPSTIPEPTHAETFFTTGPIRPVRCQLTMKQNIRGGGKTFHVVFKYLFISLLLQGVLADQPFSPHHPISRLIRGYFMFQDDVTVILILGVSFMQLTHTLKLYGQVRQYRIRKNGSEPIVISETLNITSSSIIHNKHKSVRSVILKQNGSSSHQRFLLSSFTHFSCVRNVNQLDNCLSAGYTPVGGGVSKINNVYTPVGWGVSKINSAYKSRMFQGRAGCLNT